MGAALLDEAGVVLHITERDTARNPYLSCPVTTDSALMAEAVAARVHPAALPAAGYLVYATSGATGLPKTVVRRRPGRPYKGVAVSERYGAGVSYGPT